MSLVDISFCVHFLKDLLNLFFVVSVCGTNEFVIRCIHQIPDFFDLTGYIIYKLFRCNTGFACFDLNLLTVFVCTCLETDIIALHSLKTCNTVS